MSTQRTGWVLLLGWLAILVACIAIMVGNPAPVGGTPSPAPVVAGKGNTCEAPEGALFNPCATLDTTQVQDRRPSAAECDAVVARIYATQNYTGSADEQACVGQEDDARVGLALDYGMSPDQYARAERGESQS